MRHLFNKFHKIIDSCIDLEQFELVKLWLKRLDDINRFDDSLKCLIGIWLREKQREFYEVRNEYDSSKKDRWQETSY